MKRADVNWGEVRRKYESGMYTYQRLAREYHVCTQTVWRHAIKGQWQIGREEAEKQILRRCLMATAKLLETAAAGATERLESAERMISMPDLFIFAQAFPRILVGFAKFPAGCIVVKLTIRKFSLRRKG